MHTKYHVFSTLTHASFSPPFALYRVPKIKNHVHVPQGFLALFKGAGARVAFFVPSQAVSITLFERFKTMYSDMITKASTVDPQHVCMAE
jgi:hypothetical protein